MNNKEIEILHEIKSLIQGTVTNRWMNIKEVSTYASISTSTIRRAVKRGELKCSKKHGKLLFTASDVEAWING